MHEYEDMFADVAGNSHLLEFIDLERVCRRCDSIYTERENMGQWRCRAFHPLDGCTIGFAPYRCCGGKPNSLGCVMADHTDTLVCISNPRAVSRQLAALIDIPRLSKKRAWKSDGRHGYIVERIDITGYRDRISATGAATNSALNKLTRQM